MEQDDYDGEGDDDQPLIGPSKMKFENTYVPKKVRRQSSLGNDLDGGSSTGPLHDPKALPVVIMAAYEDEGNKMSKENAKKTEGAKLKIIMPEEIYDPIYLANRDSYVALGHDTLEERGKKHYRLRLSTPLEENPDFFTVSPMPKVSILRGKAIN